MKPLLALLCLLAAPVFADKVVIGTTAPFPPFQMRDESGAITGMEPEILAEICARASLECHWTELELAGLFDALERGEIDIAATGLARTPARMARAHMSCPYRLAKTQQAGFFSLIADQPVEGARISVTAGSIDATAALKAGHEVILYPDIDQAYSAALGGQVDIFLGSPYYVSRTDTEKRLHQVGHLPVASHGTSIAVSYTRPQLARELDRQLAALSADGTLYDITSRWLKNPDPDPIADCKEITPIS